jgi:hypothetical protein
MLPRGGDKFCEAGKICHRNFAKFIMNFLVMNFVLIGQIFYKILCLA